MRLLITGAPRSGTRFITQVLNTAGVPADHESSFPGGFESGEPRMGASDGMVEVSWAGVPWIPRVEFPSVHVVRHPLKVVSSMTTLGRWREIHEEFLRQHAPRMFHYTNEIESLAAFWVEWNELAERATHRWNIHSLSVDQVMGVLQECRIHVRLEELVYGMTETASDTGHRKNTIYPNVEWEDLRSMRSEVFDLAESYGLE